MVIKLFCYRKGNSFLHKIPALIKILFMMLFCIGCFWGGQKETKEEILNIGILIHASVCFLICILLFVLGKGKVTSIAQMKWVIWFGLLVTVFRLVPENFSVLKDFEIYKPVLINGCLAGTLYTIRFFFASFACQMIFETTSSLEIREGFEAVHKGVCKILPFMKKFNLAFIISLAVTFIPEVFETWNKVTMASKARSGKKSRFFQVLLCEITALISILLGLAENKRKAILNRGYSI